MDVVNVRAKVGLGIFLIHLKFDLELLIYLVAQSLLWCDVTELLGNRLIDSFLF